MTSHADSGRICHAYKDATVDAPVFLDVLHQMCADPREAGEHPRGSVVSVPGCRKGDGRGAHSRDEGLRQPRLTERRP